MCANESHHVMVGKDLCWRDGGGWGLPGLGGVRPDLKLT